MEKREAAIRGAYLAWTHCMFVLRIRSLSVCCSAILMISQAERKRGGSEKKLQESTDLISKLYYYAARATGFLKILLLLRSGFDFFIVSLQYGRDDCCVSLRGGFRFVPVGFGARPHEDPSDYQHEDRDWNNQRPRDFPSFSQAQFQQNCGAYRLNMLSCANGAQKNRATQVKP
jgi:hypothetical protein